MTNIDYEVNKIQFDKEKVFEILNYVASIFRGDLADKCDLIKILLGEERN